MKKWFTGLFATILFFAAPAFAFACNWGAEVSGDCKTIDLTVSIATGKSEKAGYYKLYWSKKGNPKNGKQIASAEIPVLKKGEVHKVSYDVSKNENGPEGNYIFHLVEPKGSIWSKVIKVKNCEPTTPPPTNDDGGNETPPPTNDDGGEENPPPTNDDGGNEITPPINNDGGIKNPPAPTNDGTTTPANGGQLPKTATSNVGFILLGATLLVGGTLALRLQKQN